MKKVYFNHTTKLSAVKQKLAPAATIALERKDNFFHYGVTICSKDNNFDKVKGREIAEERMERGFRCTPVPEDLLALEKIKGADAVNRAFLYQLGYSVTMNSRKWKKKITRFNLEHQQNAKVVTMNLKSKTATTV